ncbi:hypothetical protein PENSPDRAFT_575865 [Peniophora sp. CONT]|nr:hypothetical protein PENSPDRAFT_575865 [Peniophora sp. CONT]
MLVNCRPGNSGSCRLFSIKAGGLPAAPTLHNLVHSDDMRQASEWISRFQRSKVLKEHVEITFSRSSGPGGQNVNKVNTKATLRVPLDLPWIPLWARDELRKSPHFAPSSQSIVMTSTATRSQAQNVEDVLSKLHDVVSRAAAKLIMNEPSEDQKKRVQKLEHVEKVRRRQEKDRRSDTKKARSKKWDD